MKLNKTFIIRHKETKEQWYSVNGKCTWKNTGAPKIAFNRKASFEDKPRYENQEEYEVVELKHESEDKLQKSIKLLEVAFEYMSESVPDRVVVEIAEFIEENSE